MRRTISFSSCGYALDKTRTETRFVWWHPVCDDLLRRAPRPCARLAAVALFCRGGPGGLGAASPAGASWRWQQPAKSERATARSTAERARGSRRGLCLAQAAFFVSKPRDGAHVTKAVPSRPVLREHPIRRQRRVLDRCLTGWIGPECCGPTPKLGRELQRFLHSLVVPARDPRAPGRLATGHLSHAQYLIGQVRPPQSSRAYIRCWPQDTSSAAVAARRE